MIRRDSTARILQQKNGAYPHGHTPLETQHI